MKRLSLAIAGTLLATLVVNCSSSSDGNSNRDSSAEAGQAGMPEGAGGEAGSIAGGASAGTAGELDQAGSAGSAGDSAGAGGEAGGATDACGGCPEASGCVDSGHGPECVAALDCDPTQPISGAIAADTYWRSGVCVFADDVTVTTAARLFIGAGVVVKSGTDATHLGLRPLIVQGKLLVLGSAQKPVVFTTRWDAGHGGKTDTNGAGPSAGAWAGIRFESGSSGTVGHADIWYATDAVHIDGATPTLSNLSVHQAAGAAISASPTDRLELNGFMSDGSGVNGLLRRAGTVDVDTTWNQTGVAQVFDGDITVPANVTLTLAEGVVVKSGDEPSKPKLRPLIVQGTLDVNGVPGNPVTFTARWDDEPLGEADATTDLPSPGAWGGIQFRSGSHGKLDYAWILFADSGALAADSSPTFNHCLFRNSSIGIHATGVSAAPTVSQSRIVDNAQGAVAEAGGTILASGNWWGTPSGPSGAGPGTGDSVSAGVNFSNALTMPPL